METPYQRNSEEGSAYILGYNDCQFGIDKHSCPWKEGVLKEAYIKGYQDCAELNFGSRTA